MCGIAGIIGPYSQELPDKIRTSLLHRGPDDSAVYEDKNIALIHTRLSILDLSSNGHQPMISEDGQYIIVFNGEIYNHNEIRAELKNKYSFRSNSDTETLLYGYIEYGKDLLNKLNGIFAFALYHKESGDLFIARDPFGVKPLYYYRDENTFYFGSEIKSFLQIADFDKSICYTSLVDYLQFLYSPSQNTAFDKVKKLLPGNYLELNVHTPSQFKITPYFEWRYTNEYQGKSEKELTNELEEILLNAIERQLISDVPVGFFLSGGLDSSLLVALAKKIYPSKQFPCFTIDNGATSYEGFADDLQYAQLVADHLNIDLHKVPSYKFTEENWIRTVASLEEPITDPAALHVSAIAEYARNAGYKVLLGGIGADEIFSGYRRHQTLPVLNRLSIIPKGAKNGLVQLLSTRGAQLPFIRRATKLLKASSLPQHLLFAYSSSWMDQNLLLELFSEETRKALAGYNSYDQFVKLWDEQEVDSLNRMLYSESQTYLPHNNLTYTDKMSMAHGVEVRVPYLDMELVHFASKLPSSLKMKGFTTKYLLRKVAEKHLPDKIIKRSKTGFGSPVRSWIKEQDSSFFTNWLADHNSDSIFDKNKIANLIASNQSGALDASYILLAVKSIECWRNQFIGSNR